MISNAVSRTSVQWSAALLGVLLVVYMLLGVFWVPSYVSGQLSSLAEKQYGLTVDTSTSSLNPFTFRYELGPTQVVHGDSTVFSLSRLSVNFDPLKTLYTGALTFGNIEIDSPDLRLRRNRSGRLNLREIITNRRKPAPAEEESTEEGWGISVEQLRLTGGTVSWENRQLTSDSTILLRDVALKARFLHYPLSARVPFNLQLRVGSGRLRVKGTMKGDRTYHTLYSLEGFPLSTLNGFLRGTVPGKFTNGQLNTRGRINGSLDGSELSVDSSGELRNVKLSGKPGQSLATLESVSVGSAELNLAEKNLVIRDVTVDSPVVNLVRKADGSLNVSQRSEPPRDAERTKTAESPSQPWSLTVGPTQLRSGRVSFEDRSLDEPMETRVEDLAGTAGVVTSRLGDTVAVQLRAKVAQRAPLESRATVTPREPEETMDLQAELRELGLPPFSPYGTQFVGYRIDSGKLQATLDYEVRNARLTGSNELILNQFSLGEKVNQKPIISAPVKLGVALLKDRDGQIRLSIPVEGNLRNPEFQLQGTINKAIVNAIQNVVNSPFDFLASLVDAKAEKLRSIDFAPGQDELNEESESSLGKLVQALQIRPQLQLGIRPAWAEADRLFLAQQQIDQELEELGAQPEDLVQSREALEELFDRRFSYDRRQELLGQYTHQPENSFTQELDREAYVNDLYDRLLKAAEPEVEKLRELATQRARIVHSALEQRGIATERLRVLDRKQLDDTKAPVSLPLQLGPK